MKYQRPSLELRNKHGSRTRVCDRGRVGECVESECVCACGREEESDPWIDR